MAEIDDLILLSVRKVKNSFQFQYNRFSNAVERATCSTGLGLRRNELVARFIRAHCRRDYQSNSGSVTRLLPLPLIESKLY